MDKKYKNILDLAGPYLKKGVMKDFYLHTLGVVRAMELLIKSDGGDADILIPAAILHDVGWSMVPKNLQKSIKSEDKAKAMQLHLDFAPEIAAEVLEKSGYDEEKASAVINIILAHKFCKPKEKEKRMLIDADALSDSFQKQLYSDAKSYNQSPYAQMEHRLNENAFYSSNAKKLFILHMAKRKKEIDAHNLKKAFEIAKRILRGRYQKQGIFAGSHHFDDYWARDSFYGSLGALAIGDAAIVKKNLELFLKYQKSNGQIPVRIGVSRFGVVAKVFNIRLPFISAPRYWQDKGFNPSTDQNSLLIIAFYEYMKKTKDIDFLKKYYPKLIKCIEWNLLYNIDDDLLMEEGPFATWQDNIKKTGKVLYTNVCHLHALYCISKLFEMLKERKVQDKYMEFYKKTKEKLNEYFWNGDYYIDWFDKKEFDYFATDGNALAIIWGIADKEQAEKIMESSEELGINRSVPSLTNLPFYPKGIATSFFLNLIGLHDYQNGMCWLFLGCMDALAKWKSGMKKESIEVLSRIAEIIVRYNDVYEVYSEDGKPIMRTFYKSENNFTWTAGMYVLAYKEIYRQG